MVRFGHQVGFEPILVLREIGSSGGGGGWGVWRAPELTKGPKGPKGNIDYIPYSRGIRILHSVFVVLPITALEASKMQFPEPHYYCFLHTFYLMHDCLRAKGV